MKTISEIKLHLKDRILQRLRETKTSQLELAETIGVERRVVNRQLNAGFEQTTVQKLLEMLLALDEEIEIKFTSTRP